MLRLLTTFNKVVLGDLQLSKGDFSCLDYICIPQEVPELLADDFVTALIS